MCTGKVQAIATDLKPKSHSTTQALDSGEDRFEAVQQKVLRLCNNAKVEAHIGGLEAPRKILRQIKRLLLLATQPTSAKENDETQDTKKQNTS